MGTDPFNPADDNMTAPLPELTPGNTRINIHSGIVVGTATPEIEAAPAATEPGRCGAPGQRASGSLAALDAALP